MISRRSNGVSRRALIRTGVVSASLVVVAPSLLGAEAHAQQKSAKAQVQYQDSPKDGKKCADCAHFVQPSSCKLVEGTVSPQGWCAQFTVKSG